MGRKVWVTVKPQAKKAEVKKIADGQYVASIHAPAREGKANEELREVLGDYFSVAKSSVRILLGRTGRRKLVEIG